MDQPNITLRYFNARGRAQHLRYYLLVRNIDFADERVAIDNEFAEWIAMRDDDALSGPFQKLPLLRFGKVTVAETLVITSFLHKKLGDAAQLSEQENLRHEMLCSSLYGDVMFPIGMLIWATLLYKGVDIADLSTNVFTRIRSHMTLLDRRLANWRWLDAMQGRPLMLADCLLWEEIDIARVTFGQALDLKNLPTLATFYERYRTGTAFARLLETKPCQITGRPGEEAVLAIIRESVAHMNEPPA